MIVRTALQVFTLLFSLLCCLSPVMAEVVAALPVIHLKTNNIHPGEVGAKLGHEVKRYFPDIEQQYDNYLAQRFSQHALDTTIKMRLPAMLSRLDSDYSKELYGVANAWALGNSNKLGDGKLSLAEYQVLNLLSDLGMAPDGSGFAVMGKASVTGTPIVGRNLDWTQQPELRHLQTITIYQNGSEGIVNIGFAGIISVLTGFNETGLFVAGINAEPFSPYLSNEALPGESGLFSFDLRKTLETRHSVKKAGRFLSGKNYGYNQNILLADKSTVQVLEHNTDEKARMRSWDNRLQSGKRWGKPYQIAVVDCFVLPMASGTCDEAKDIARWKRFSSLAIYNHKTPANVQNITDIMRNTDNYQYEILNTNTLQSVIFQPEQLALQLYHTPPDGQHPQHPFYADYPSLLPNAPEFDMQIFVNILIWSLLIILLGIAIWQIRKR